MPIKDQIIVCKKLKKIYTQGPEVVEVLSDINLEIIAGEKVAIVGSSGSGKTTLLNLLGGLDIPTSGSVSVAGKELFGMDESEGHDLSGVSIEAAIEEFVNLLDIEDKKEIIDYTTDLYKRAK